MNTPECSKSMDADTGRPPRTPIIAERYNMSEPPLSTRLERMQSTPRLQLKPAPRLIKSLDRRSLGRGITDTHQAKIVSFSSTPPKLSPIYNPNHEETYIDQVFIREDEIGEGSFGRVYRMKDRQTGKLYAIKCSQVPYRTSRDRREKHQEVQMHELIPKHENLVEFIAAWEERDLLYIQTELCEMSLEEHLYRYSPLPEWRIWDVLLDLSNAVYHLSNHNLIHADIKPANILVSFDGVCKLGDFGLMVDVSKGDIEDDERYEGDSRYLALEVLNSHVTKESVIFSLGLSILQIATDLYLPSCGQRWHDIRELNIDPKFTERLTPELVNLIYRMMAIEPADRPSISTILNSSLLREHSKYRGWNKSLYAVFRTLMGSRIL